MLPVASLHRLLRIIIVYMGYDVGWDVVWSYFVLVGMVQSASTVIPSGWVGFGIFHNAAQLGLVADDAVVVACLPSWKRQPCLPRTARHG